jgi:SAM-dependent methyltransferase
MTALRDHYVRTRFDTLATRFRENVAESDFRLAAVRRVLPPLDNLRVLDLGAGKGRFARHLADAGARVVALDASTAMLSAARGLDRVHAAADRLPFPDGAFDAVIAIELFEHLSNRDTTLDEMWRVLRPGGTAVLIDKNLLALDARLPLVPAAARKWLDERRGRWMYPPDAPVRERWFVPKHLARQLASRFETVQIAYLLRPEEASWVVFRRLPSARLFTLWSARRGGPSHA